MANGEFMDFLIHIFAERRRRLDSSSRSTRSTDSSQISSNKLNIIVTRLLGQQNRVSTRKTYFRIWRQFNAFLIRLDNKPKDWESRVTLYIGHLIEKGIQSNSIKSYVSAIKRILMDDGYEWEDQKILLSSLTRACRLVNDAIKTRLPIQCGLLELILFEVTRIMNLNHQTYLKHLYLTIFSIGYYGLMRIGEVTQSDHVIQAINVHIATNKNKILLISYSSKTHNEGNRPQKIKITSNNEERTGSYRNRHFCPFQLIRNYIKIRPQVKSMQEQFFVFSDNSPVTSTHVRNILKLAISNLGLDDRLYGYHSLRIGRSTDLIKYHYSISEVKLIGRWRSNVIFKYIRQ